MRARTIRSSLAWGRAGLPRPRRRLGRRERAPGEVAALVGVPRGAPRRREPPRRTRAPPRRSPRRALRSPRRRRPRSRAGRRPPHPHALPEHGALHARPRPDDRAGSDDGVGAHLGAGLRGARAGADHGRALDPRGGRGGGGVRPSFPAGTLRAGASDVVTRPPADRSAPRDTRRGCRCRASRRGRSSRSSGRHRRSPRERTPARSRPCGRWESARGAGRR